MPSILLTHTFKQLRSTWNPEEPSQGKVGRTTKKVQREVVHFLPLKRPAALKR